MWKTTTVILVLTIGLAQLFNWQSVVDIPELPETFWGQEKHRNAPTDVRPFKIDVPNSVIDDLKQRLKNTRPLAEPLDGVAWTYGIPAPQLKNVLEYWQSKYNWTDRQARLNKYPQFKTNIQGLDIHFYRVKPFVPKDKNVKILPLLLLHGWPGSIVEFQKIIPILTTPRSDKSFVFEVIAPSLPGYGFSDPPIRPGMGPAQIGLVFKNLMHRLGYERFYIQGGDWGAAIVASMAALYPDSIIGVHSNMCVAQNGIWSLLRTVTHYLIFGGDRQRPHSVRQMLNVMLEETGYMHIQASKPDTIGSAVSQSPASLAAYILEKFSTWTNMEYRQRPDGGLLEKFSMDELLDNLMVYWVTNSVTTSMRLYAEQFSSSYGALKIDSIPINVPSACASFPNELFHQPQTVVRSRFHNLIQFNYLERGGHFAALEEPALLADDIFSYVEKRENMLKEEESAKKEKSKDKKN